MSIRRVAITGGARGIGRATAEACLREGMSVVIGDIDGNVVAAVAGELGPRVVDLPLDVRDQDSFEAFLDEAERRIGLPGSSSRSCVSGSAWRLEKPTNTGRFRW
jgi:NAD(P)-dependent dehydrogenase (short-subunit alcohol dehydrogenase family)